MLQEHVPFLVAEVRLQRSALIVGRWGQVEAKVGKVTHDGGLLPPMAL